jgi:hypothetical protein
MQKFNDADLLSAYDDSRYEQPVTVSIGANKKAKNWRPDEKTPDVRALIYRLSEHREGRKDGPALVFGDIVPGERKKTAVREIYAVGLDDDLDPDLPQLADRMKQANRLAICYTTHSHLKTTTQIRRDDLARFAPDAEHDSALAQRYLAEKKHWPARLTETVEYEGTAHTSDGVMCIVKHKPIAKVRIVVPLRVPFRIADFRTSKEAEETWRKIVLAVAKLYGVAGEFDETSGDLNRLFYLPRHAPGAEHETMLCGGELLDWRELELDDLSEQLAKEAGRSGGKSQTPEGGELSAWSHKYAEGFQIADVIENHCPEKIRGNASVGFDIECPHDDSHGNAGDPDDRACFVANAGDTSAPVFVIKCQHNSCREFTNLDLLGKMLADGWFPRDVLESDDYNALGEGAGTQAGDDATESADWLEPELETLGPKPQPKELKALLDRVAAMEDLEARDLAFATVELQVVGGPLKRLVQQARTEANKAAKQKRKAESTGRKKGAKFESKIEVPTWGTGCFVDPELRRPYVWGVDDEGTAVQLHTPLRLCADMIYVDTLEAGKECQGVCIEFEDKDGNLVRRSFTLGQALAPRTSDESIIKHLSNSGVGFATKAGMERVEQAVSASGKSQSAGKVYGTPGARGDNFFLHADGTVIGTPGHYVELESPIALERRGNLDNWRTGIAVAFRPDVVDMRPHIAATILWTFVSPLIDVTKADGMMFALVGPTRSYKSFAFKCGGSAWGSVSEKGRGVIYTFSSTTTKLEEDAMSLSGHAFFADDTSQIKAQFVGQTVCDFAFRITSNGKRGRWGEDHKSFRLAAAISSESRLAELMRLSSYEAPRGLMSRVLEVSTGEAVPDKDHADATGQPIPDDLVKAMTGAWDNPGHAGPAFVQAMFAGGWTREKIGEAVDSHVRDLNGKSEQERSASRAVAFLLVAGTIAQEAKLIPAEFDLRAFALKLWQESRAVNDTAKEMTGRVYEALHREFLSGGVTIYDGYRDRVIKARGGVGIELHTEFRYTKEGAQCFTPAFVVPKAALQKIGGLRENDRTIASAIARDGLLIRERKDKLGWREESRVGLKAYVIDARAVFGDDCDPKIELHTKALGETLIEKIEARLAEALEDHKVQRAEALEAHPD